VGTPLADQKLAVTLARRYLLACSESEATMLLATLVHFPTVRAHEAAADGSAFLAMAQFLGDWAHRYGFRMETHGANEVWSLSYGPEGPAKVAFLTHADVVPASETPMGLGDSERPADWTYPPFRLAEVDERLYGRGTEDDKGPIAASLTVLRILKQFGYQPQGGLSVIMGTGEEHEWAGMIDYAKTKPQPRFTISVDAGYPVVVAESGFVAWHLAWPKAEALTPNCWGTNKIHAGQFLTQVPGEASLELQAPLEAARALAPSAELTQAEGFTRLVTRGNAVHSSVADEGDNALWKLASLAEKLPLCAGGTADALRFLREYLVDDHWGQRLGLAYEHPLMGKLLVTPTLLRGDDAIHLSINMRRPAGLTATEFESKLDALLLELKRTYPQLSEFKPRYVGEPAFSDPEQPLPRTLLQIYRELAQDPAAQPISIRGGTYARLFPGAVSFGPALPGEVYRGHAPDEYLTKRALRMLLATSLEAVLRLDPL